MSTQSTIDEILSQKTIAVAGVSRGGRGFGVAVYRHLRGCGYTVFGLNRSAGAIDGDQLYPSLRALPEKPDVVVTVVPPAETAALVREASDLGVTRIWMQQGSESDEAVAWCREHGVGVVHGECIMMFAVPVKGLHRVHRWVNKITGRMPE